MARTRSIETARVRQIKRRAHRAAQRNVKGPPPARHVDVTDAAIRVQVGDAKNSLRRTQRLAGALEDTIARLERRLGRRAT
jgi:hypothetical protein